jgi:hypothetical protein
MGRSGSYNIKFKSLINICRMNFKNKTKEAPVGLRVQSREWYSE